MTTIDPKLLDSTSHTTAVGCLKILEEGYRRSAGAFCGPTSRLEFLGERVFGFTTDDGEMSALFAKRALEVCAAITQERTFDYIKDPVQYQWYLLMCNLPFFSSKIEYGVSIRGAWWDNEILFHCLDLWPNRGEVEFSYDQWADFTYAMSEFANKSDITGPEGATTPP